MEDQRTPLSPRRLHGFAGGQDQHFSRHSRHNPLTRTGEDQHHAVGREPRSLAGPLPGQHWPLEQDCAQNRVICARLLARQPQTLTAHTRRSGMTITDPAVTLRDHSGGFTVW